MRQAPEGHSAPEEADLYTLWLTPDPPPLAAGTVHVIKGYTGRCCLVVLTPRDLNTCFPNT